VALALAGVAIVLKTPGADWPVPASLSDWLAVAAGFSFALANILLRRLRGVPGDARALAMFAGCVVVAGAMAWLGTSTGSIPAPPLADVRWWPWALLLGAAYAIGNVALQYGASRIAASATSVIMLSEVVFASTSSIALGAAAPDARVWTGGALILLAAAWSARDGVARSSGGDDDPLSLHLKEPR
jgi:drug/metabolite transporter (DMT)-like permease